MAAKSGGSRSAGAGVRATPTPSFAERTLAALDRSPAAKAVAGWAAQHAGTLPGIARGGIHTAQDFGDALSFGASLATDQRARDRAGKAATGAVDYVADRARNPRKLGRDLQDQFRKANQKLNPEATPVAPTLGGEILRRLNIGMNQGEFAFDIASTPVGGPAARGARTLGRFARPMTKADYAALGYDPKLAAYFAELYDGRGHHFIPRGTKVPPRALGVPIPKPLVGRRLPRQVIESPLNIQRPRGMTKGEFFKLHYGVDPSYGGGRRRGGGGWSGEQLGWEKYDLAGRLWYGSPGALKDTAWVIATSPGFAYDLVDRDGWSEEDTTGSRHDDLPRRPVYGPSRDLEDAGWATVADFGYEWPDEEPTQ